MQKVISVVALSNFSLRVTFEDGTEGVVALTDRLFGPVFEPLRDLARFREVFLDEYGVVCWPNGADLAPDALYEQIRASAATTAPR